MENTHILTVSTSYNTYEPKTGYPRHTTYTSVPCIRLKGKWLEEAGFSAGDQAVIEINEGRLVIRKVGSDSGN